VGRLLRALLLVLVGATVVIVAGQVSRFAGLVAFVTVTVGILALFIVLPRAAHDAFESGRFVRASRLYRIMRLYVLDPGVRAAIDVSLAGCRLAAADWAGALRGLEHVDPERLAPSARAAFYNNRAYAHARGKLDAGAALADIEHAMRLRPDVPGFRHTRGLALMACGRLDEAIGELDGMWRRMGAEDAPALLEAERCYDLGMAWMLKNETDYARDYFQRVRTIAPGSPWAAEAVVALRRLPRSRADDDTLPAALAMGD
jgi:tetratricopeptide (TPR) repeat protein